MLDRILRVLDLASNAGGYLSAMFMVLIVVLMSLEIFSRSVLGASTLVVSDYSGYFLVALVVLGLGFTLREDGHIRIRLIRARIPESLGKWLDVSIALAAMVMTGFALRVSLSMALASQRLDMRADTIAQTPLWIPQIVIPVGLALLLIQLLAFIIRRIRSSSATR
jgi:TRAP-type transport system small permease protein